MLFALALILILEESITCPVLLSPAESTETLAEASICYLIISFLGI
jgi:hypothetical protein